MVIQNTGLALKFVQAFAGLRTRGMGGSNRDEAEAGRGNKSLASFLDVFRSSIPGHHFNLDHQTAPLPRLRQHCKSPGGVTTISGLPFQLIERGQRDTRLKVPKSRSTNHSSSSIKVASLTLTASWWCHFKLSLCPPRLFAVSTTPTVLSDML